LAYEGNQLIEIGTARYGAYEGDAHCEFAVAVRERERAGSFIQLGEALPCTVQSSAD